jgi:hypothetical protein
MRVFHVRSNSTTTTHATPPIVLPPVSLLPSRKRTISHAVTHWSRRHGADNRASAAHDLAQSALIYPLGNSNHDINMATTKARAASILL